MKLLSCLVLGLFVIALTSTPAYARTIKPLRHADMFYNNQLAGNRPWVPSDAQRGEDMFANIPAFRTHKSVFFHRTRPVAISTRSDMVYVRRRTAIPYWSPIFTNDGWTN